MSKKIIYNSLLLTPESKAVIKRKYPGVHPNYYGEHVTLEFQPKFMPDNIGDEVIIEVTGYAVDSRGEALVVKLNTVTSSNDVPHITLSTAHGTKPFYSNDLLKDKFRIATLKNPFKIKTVISSFIGGGIGHVTNPSF
jgi:hypothetical protein